MLRECHDQSIYYYNSDVAVCIVILLFTQLRLHSGNSVHVSNVKKRTLNKLVNGEFK